MHPYLGDALRWIVLLHVLSAFGFALLHGPSVFAMFMLRSERELAKVQALLTLSRRSSELSWIAWSLLALSGLALAATEHTWRRPWVWGSIVVLVLVTGLMSPIAARAFNEARHAAGLPYFDGKGVRPAGVASRADLDAALARIRARVPAIAALGVGGLAILLWLMVSQPTF